jgi:aspartyl-tRNA(Asn)/glutamyl-tRNA(Gln) amidotransferase subunit A
MSALAVANETLHRLAAANPELNAATRLLAERAKTEALAVDAIVASGGDPGPLAGVPYGVKDLFDVAGLPTTAGSLLYADAQPANADATAIDRLRHAGAVLVATLNMDEFAYGFATVNALHGTTRNPHDQDRLAGGSSGGSAAAVAAGLLPFTLGSDTNGSIRVPASLTGLFGLKPTHHGLPMTGVFPFADSFDDIGPFTRNAQDMRVVWEVLSGRPVLSEIENPRIARLGGRFDQNCHPDQRAAMNAITGDTACVVIDDVIRARSAAFLITAYEGGAFHKSMLACNAMAFDPATRDRLLAGALLPAAIYRQAKTFQKRFQDDMLRLFDIIDVLLAPAAPCVAPTIADPFIEIDGERRPARADLGIHTQPVTLTGFPSLTVPLRGPNGLPLGIQLIGRPGSEPTLFAYAAMLETAGLVGTSDAPCGQALESGSTAP